MGIEREYWAQRDFLHTPEAKTEWCDRHTAVVKRLGLTVTRVTQDPDTPGRILFEAWSKDLWDPNRAGRLRSDVTLEPPQFESL